MLIVPSLFSIRLEDVFAHRESNFYGWYWNLKSDIRTFADSLQDPRLVIYFFIHKTQVDLCKDRELYVNFWADEIVRNYCVYFELKDSRISDIHAVFFVFFQLIDCDSSCDSLQFRKQRYRRQITSTSCALRFNPSSPKRGIFPAARCFQTANPIAFKYYSESSLLIALLSPSFYYPPVGRKQFSKGDVPLQRAINKWPQKDPCETAAII